MNKYQEAWNRMIEDDYCESDGFGYEHYNYVVFDKDKEIIYQDEINYYKTSSQSACTYFRTEEDIQSFIEEAGKERIKNYMFDIWED